MKKQFEADTGRVLNIVINSLYSDKDIFLRELISNSSDAIDKRRFMETSGAVEKTDAKEHQIEISTDKSEGSMVISDTGIGMSVEELDSALGTIAKSGTSEFLESLEAQKTDDNTKSINLIGQFGVGFYSAFMVADRVEVLTRKIGEEKANKWMSDGLTGYEIEKFDKNKSGTEIKLFLNKVGKEYLKKEKIQEIIKKYSDHVQYPIKWVDTKSEDLETLNDASAIWTKAKSDITKEQHAEFFRQTGGGFGDPLLTIHNKAEGVISYTSLVYIPENKPFDLFHVERAPKVKLYSNRVFITDTLETVLPRWLRFVSGILDTSDINLNVSRELLQNSPTLRKISKTLKKRILTELGKLKEKDPEKFEKFWENFGAVIKEGIYEDADSKVDILALSKFKSVNNQSSVFLSEYLDKMHKKQDAIYYLASENIEQAENSPHLEAFRKKKLDVLILTDPIDTFWLSVVNEFKHKKFMSITHGEVNLDKFDETKDKSDKKDNKKFETLIAKVKEVLGEKVADVRISNKLVDSTCCLVASDSGMDVHMERMMMLQNKDFKGMPRVLELNPDHKLIKKLNSLVGKKDNETKQIALTLYDQARLMEGQLPEDIGDYCSRVSDYMQSSL
ncbi:MAG: molecular chaperone HtpG [Paracoccaceae bacterium]